MLFAALSIIKTNIKGGEFVNFANARKEAGLKQVDVAKAVGVTQGAVSMWETGANKPRTAHLPLLSKLLNVPIERLIESDGTKDN